jgi:hypothetical protein
MDFAAIEAEFPYQAPVVEPTPLVLVWYNVYFRDEYYGHVPEAILDDVKLYMGLAGGFDFDPATLTLRSLHKADCYRLLVSKITVRLHGWMRAEEPVLRSGSTVNGERP